MWIGNSRWPPQQDKDLHRIEWENNLISSLNLINCLKRNLDGMFLYIHCRKCTVL
jgi:hypothetical protein